ncbi:MAG: NIPSNAP family protein [Hyphomonadaceae bacterium]|nr:NIPSNAP family protein [Hyphomonadaceae bacterium]
MPNDTIYEFRDYTLHPGKRDVLIELFEREFIEPQEALGSHVRATFRDLDDPDRFVWIRSFADADARYSALDGFYTGAVWRQHRNAANATIVDSDNVMQLRLLSGSLGAQAHGDISNRAPIVATAYFIAPHAERDFAAHFTRDVIPALGSAVPFASLITEHAPNSYPRLPVRENECVLLTLARFPSIEAHADTAGASVDTSMLTAPTMVRRLQPTARSALR